MNGFIVKKIDPLEKYTGIDACNKDLIWIGLKSWNDSNPHKNLIIESSIFAWDWSNNLAAYYKWAKEVYGDQVYLQWFNTNSEQGGFETENYESISLGYDCAFIEQDYLSFICFSSLLHELEANRVSELYAFKKQLNKFGLFNYYKTALDYIKLRNALFSLAKGNFENVFDTKLIAVEVFKIQKKKQL